MIFHRETAFDSESEWREFVVMMVNGHSGSRRSINIH